MRKRVCDAARVLAAFVAALLVAVLVPVFALAVEETPEPEAAGSEDIVENSGSESGGDVENFPQDGDGGSDWGGGETEQAGISQVTLTEEQYQGIIARLDTWALILFHGLMLGFGVSVGVELGKGIV